MKRLLRKFTGWMVKKTNYTIPEIPLQIKPIIIKPEDLKKFHAQHIVDWFEWRNTPFTPDCFVKGFKYQLVNKLLDEIIIKVDETPDGVMYSADLLFKCI